VSDCVTGAVDDGNGILAIAVGVVVAFVSVALSAAKSAAVGGGGNGILAIAVDVANSFSVNGVGGGGNIKLSDDFIEIGAVTGAVTFDDTIGVDFNVTGVGATVVTTDGVEYNLLRLANTSLANASVSKLSNNSFKDIYFINYNKKFILIIYIQN
jgi:hypothetical protein